MGPDADGPRPPTGYLDRTGRQQLGPVVLVGVLGGGAGAAFVGLLHLLMRGLWPTHHSGGVQLAIMVGVGIAVSVLVRLLGSPGDVELLVDNIHVEGGRRDLRELRSLLPVSLLCVAAGGGMGPEAPLVQTTGGIGTWLGLRRKLGARELRILTITGMAAGFTVLFGAPLGAALFALEMLHRRGLEYYEALLPAIVGSVCGLAVYALLGAAGIGPVWELPDLARIEPVYLLWAVAAGVVGAAIATIFDIATQYGRRLFAVVPGWLAPVLGGLALGLLAWWSPFALTFGEQQVDRLLLPGIGAAALGVAAAAKLIGTTVTLSSGWRGGFIIPLFFVGIALGGAWHVLVPGVPAAVLMAGLMAATNVGVTKTPLGTTLVVTEMSGLHLLPTTLVASVIALLLTSQVTVIASQRSRSDAAEPGAADAG